MLLYDFSPSTAILMPIASKHHANGNNCPSIRPIPFFPRVIPAQLRLMVSRLNHSIHLQLQTIQLRSSGLLRPDRDGDVVCAGVVEDAFWDGEFGLRAEMVD